MCQNNAKRKIEVCTILRMYHVFKLELTELPDKASLVVKNGQKVTRACKLNVLFLIYLLVNLKILFRNMIIKIQKYTTAHPRFTRLFFVPKIFTLRDIFSFHDFGGRNLAKITCLLTF